jgi:radical SAM superfamily enzyme YgiQ (UPF0313 family)
MKVLLVYPEWPDTYWSFRHALPFHGKRAAYPPLGLLTIASFLPSSWEKRLVDMNVRQLKDSDLEWADVAMFSGMLIHKDQLIAELDRCRAKGVRTVIGGPVASSLEELKQHADHVVIGEAEDLMDSLVRGLEAGNAEPLYHATSLPQLDRTPLPDLSLIKLKHYSAMALQYSRGCPFNCEFCDIIEIYGRRPRTKTVPQVLAELDQLYTRKWRGSVFFVDDNFIGNKRNVKELLPAVADWNHRHGTPFVFYTEASINLADDAELLQLMKDANFMRVFIGIETPEEASLKSAQKTQNTKRSLLENVRRIQAYGMEVMAGFIVGFDSDTEDIFDRQVKFIQESAIPMAMVGLLQALPNTQLYRRLMREGRLVNYGLGDNTSCDLNFLPIMDAQRLIHGYRSILQRIYNQKAYYDRVREFLSRYRPTVETRYSLADYMALVKSMLKQGLLHRGRTHYWKFFFDASTRYRHAFGTAITLAIMGYHFQMVTQRVLESEV